MRKKKGAGTCRCMITLTSRPVRDKEAVSKKLMRSLFRKKQK